MIAINCINVVRFSLLLCSITVPINSIAEVAVTLSVEGITDNVDYSPNLENGGFAKPEARPRFQAYTLRGDWQVTPQLSLSLSVAHREMNSLRNSFEIGQISLSAFTLLSSQASPYTLGLSLGISVNQSDALIKNSYTYYNGATIREVSINQPQDITFLMGLHADFPLMYGFTLSTNLGIGLVQSDHGSIQGQGQSEEGCQYEFLTNGQTGNLVQQGSCGALIGYSQQFSNENGIEERLGFRSSQDVAYRARVLEVGTGTAWAHKSMTLALAYRVRYYDRGQLDKRISDTGNTPTRFSHVARATASYQVSPHWSLSLSSIYQTAPYLDDVPMLYTTFTSQRFSGTDALSFLARSTITF